MKQRFFAVGAAVLAGAGTALFGTPAVAAQEQWHLKFLNVAAAHKISTGKGVTVAVVDTGVGKNPDLAGSVVKGTDFIDSGGDGRIDRDSHGTRMAGLVAAHGKSGQGATGIAPDAKILPIRVLKSERAQIDLGPAIDYAVAHNAKVINLSVGGSIDPDTLNAVKAAQEADVVIVAAAGNKPDAFTVVAPAFLDSIVAVGSVDESGKQAANSVPGDALDLMAPGVKIRSTNPGGGYGSGTGTSDAAAIVSGAAALIRSKYPTMSATEVVQRLESTAIDKGAPGVDPDYGHGIIDIVAALSDTPGAGSGTAASAPPPSPATAAPRPEPTTAEAAPETEPASNAGPLIVGGVAVLVLVGGLFAFLLVRRRMNH